MKYMVVNRWRSNSWSNRSMVALLFIFLSLGSGVQANQQSRVDALDAYIEASRRLLEVPGVAVAIVKDGKIIHLKGYGVRDVSTSQPVTPETIFAIGSTTKAFTTTAMAMLVDEDKMAWDDPVRKYIEFFRLSDPLANEYVTLRDLVTHRTGLARFDLPWWYGAPLTREEIIRRLALVSLKATFRQKWQYNNEMFVAAGYAVGGASHSTWEEFVRRRIFDPLGMQDANFSVAMTQRTPNHAMPHDKREGKLVTIPWRKIDAVGPAGSINDSARDMAKWILLHLNNGMFGGKRFVSEKSMKEMHTPQMVVRIEDWLIPYFPESTQLSYGLGWFIDDYRGHQVIFHGGGIDGFVACVGFVPEKNFGFVILSNRDETFLPYAVGYYIIDAFLNLPEKNWNEYYERIIQPSPASSTTENDPPSQPSHRTQAYVGRYENPAYGELSIALEGAQLTLHYYTFAAKLKHYRFDTFDLQPTLQDRSKVTFRLTPDGEIGGLSVGEIEFERKP